MKGLIYLYALMSLMFYSPIVGPGAAGIASERTKTAHAYHGIGFSIEDDTGAYFYRGGQRCKLFTDGFKRWEKRRAPTK